MIWDKIWVEDKNFLVIVEPAETCDSLTDAVEVLKTAFISIHLPNQGSISLTVLCLISILCAWHWNFTPQKSFLKVRRIVQKLGKGCKPVYEIDPRAYFYQKKSEFWEIFIQKSENFEPLNFIRKSEKFLNNIF